MDEDGTMVRDGVRMTSRWQADANIVKTVETSLGVLNVATTSSSGLAQHIAGLHNRTLGDGQDPPPGYIEDPGPVNQALRNERRPPRADDVIDAARYAVGSHRPPRPGAAVRAYLDAANRSGYLDGIGQIVEAEVRDRVTKYAAREPARISIAESPEAMVWALRKLGFIVKPAGETPAPAVVEIAHYGPANGVRLLVDGQELIHANDGDTGGYGITWAARMMAKALGLRMIDFGEEKS